MFKVFSIMQSITQAIIPSHIAESHMYCLIVVVYSDQYESSRRHLQKP